MGTLGDAALTVSLDAAGSAAQWTSGLRSEVTSRAKPDQDNYSAAVAWVALEDEETTRIFSTHP